MEILLALGSAVAYGLSDFAGGMLSKSMRVLVVVLYAQLVGIVLVLAVVPFWEGDVSTGALAWGAAAGIAGAAGAAFLYRGLAIGRMSVVAPTTGVLAAAIPVLVGLATGERPGTTALAGVALAFIAVIAVTRAPDHPLSEKPGSRRGIAEAFGAGAGFGVFFVLLERSPADSGLWPLIGMRISMIVGVGLLIALTRTPIKVSAGKATYLLALAVANIFADLLYLLATREGLLSIVAVLTSLYPAVTVVLARLVLQERMVRQQLGGLGLAAASVVLIALG